MQGSTLKNVIALAERIPPQNIETHSRKISQNEAEINHINDLLRDLLGVEEQAMLVLNSRLGNIKRSREALMDKKEQMEKLEKIGASYYRLSLEPLTWRDADGFPRLVVFTLKSPTFSLTARPTKGDSTVYPFLPGKIAGQYRDVLDLLESKRQEKKGLQLTCKFEGLIPREVRQKINEARDLFGDHIFIVAEPGSLTLNEITPLPTKRDPLIVGYDPEADADSLWLIADFDTTPVEEAMIFTQTTAITSHDKATQKGERP
jgi:hypothetical protein